MTNWILSSPMSWNCSARSAIFAMLDRPLSTVSDLVAASRNRTSRSGRASTPADLTLLTIEAMNACWREIRPMSEPSPSV